MDLLIIPVPIFSKEIAVEAYIFRYQKGNDILEVQKGPGRLDGVMNSPALEMLKTVKLETITTEKSVFVPITNYMLLANLEKQCSQRPDRIVFLIDSSVKAEDEYIDNIKRLKALGFRFALQKISGINEINVYAPILELCDYIFYDYRIADQQEQQISRALISKNHKHLQAIYSHIYKMEDFEDVSGKVPGWFEGRFYRTPITKGNSDVSPLQVNLINLLNAVHDEDFEFAQISGIIAKDPSLTVALLRLVNSAYFGVRNKISTINHAVTMLGQKEIRKWITTAVSKLLGTDKPSEITRLSLIRAKFAELLAEKFGMKSEGDSLFLMGLFSVLDTIIEKPMNEALELVHVSDEIYDALVNQTGAYYPVYEFIQLYESASWNALSRLLILRELAASDIYEAYIGALQWYRDILTEPAE